MLLQVIKKVRELLSNPGHWIQHRRHIPSTNSYCLVGAYCYAAYGKAYPDPNVPRLIDAPSGYRNHDDYNEADVAYGIPPPNTGAEQYVPRAHEFNDDYNTTHADVLAFLDNRIAELEEQGRLHE